MRTTAQVNIEGLIDSSSDQGGGGGLSEGRGCEEEGARTKAEPEVKGGTWWSRRAGEIHDGTRVTLDLDEEARLSLSDGQGTAKGLTGRGEEIDLEACGAARGSPL